MRRGCQEKCGSLMCLWNIRGLPSTSLRTLAMQAATAARALGCWGASASVTARAVGCTDHLTFPAPRTAGRGFHYGIDFAAACGQVIALVGYAGGLHRLPPALHRPHRRPAHRPEPFPWPHSVCRWAEFHCLCPIPMRARGTGWLARASTSDAPAPRLPPQPAVEASTGFDGSGPASSSP